MSLMSLAKVRNPWLSFLEMCFFFCCATAAWFFLVPKMAAPIAFVCRAIDVVVFGGAWAPSAEKIAIWMHVVAAVGYLGILMFYWAPADEDTNRVELRAFTVFLVLAALAAALYVELKWGQLSALTGIKVRFIAAAMLVWLGAKVCAELPDATYERCFVAHLAFATVGICLSVTAGLIARAVFDALFGPVTGAAAAVVALTLIALHMMWLSIAEILQTSYRKAISASVFLVGAAAGVVVLTSVLVFASALPALRG